MTPDLRCAACGKVHDGARMVTLLNGTQASNYSEAWRLECEARHVANLPTTWDRRTYLFGEIDQWGKPVGGVKQRRGEAAAKQLAELVAIIWRERKAEAAAA